MSGRCLMSIDKELIRRKVKLIGEDYEKFKPVLAKTYNEFAESVIDQPATERYLERIIGRMIDINYHFVSEMKKFPPKDYYESFQELGTLQIIPAARAIELARYAGLRNRLAHEYDTIDPRILFEEAKQLLKELPEYLQAIEARLEGRDSRQV